MSHLEDTLAQQLRLVGLPAPEREYRFAPPRRWRFDFSWKDRMLAVEVEGGVYSRGRHTRGSGFRKDLEKANAATLLGWRLLRFTAHEIKSGAALKVIEQALATEAIDPKWEMIMRVPVRVPENLAVLLKDCKPLRRPNRTGLPAPPRQAGRLPKTERGT